MLLVTRSAHKTITHTRNLMDARQCSGYPCFLDLESWIERNRVNGHLYPLGHSHRCTISSLPQAKPSGNESLLGRIVLLEHPHQTETQVWWSFLWVISELAVWAHDKNLFNFSLEPGMAASPGERRWNFSLLKISMCLSEPTFNANDLKMHSVHIHHRYSPTWGSTKKKQK